MMLPADKMLVRVYRCVFMSRVPTYEHTSIHPHEHTYICARARSLSLSLPLSYQNISKEISTQEFNLCH